MSSPNSGSSSSHSIFSPPTLPSFLTKTPIQFLGFFPQTGEPTDATKLTPIQTPSEYKLDFTRKVTFAVQNPSPQHIPVIRHPTARRTFVSHILAPRTSYKHPRSLPVSSPPTPVYTKVRYNPKSKSKTSATPIDKRPKRHESRCLQRIVPGLYIAFEDDCIGFQANQEPNYTHPLKHEEEMCTPMGESFTHIVNLLRSTKTAGVSQSVCASSGARQLNISIHCPDTDMAVDDDVDRKTVTKLDRCQLVVIRDFLATSGHEFFESWYTTNGVPFNQMTDDQVRLLVTAPRDRRADAVSAIVCYMASASGMPARAVLASHDMERGIAGLWKNILSEPGIAFVESVVAA